MPEIRDYHVVETRSVRVSANTLVDAVRIASAAFEHGQNSSGGVSIEHAPDEIWGNTTSRIRIEKMEAERI